MTRVAFTEELITVASTHWDREWYRTFSEFRIRLRELVNRLLPPLEGGTFDRYTFDGQSMALEDYLEAYPENEGPIRKYELTPDLSGADERIGMSALKKWRFGNGLVLRLFNNSGETVSFSFGAGRGTVKVSLADLPENPLEELPVTGGRVSLRAAPGGIITLVLRRA
jgi:alpha-mannosidase